MVAINESPKVNIGMVRNQLSDNVAQVNLLTGQLVFNENFIPFSWAKEFLLGQIDVEECLRRQKKLEEFCDYQLTEWVADAGEIVFAADQIFKSARSWILIEKDGLYAIFVNSSEFKLKSEY